MRKISEGVGVERIFPVHSPYVEKIEVESSSDVRRSRLYYLRALQGKKARLKESERFGDIVAPDDSGSGGARYSRDTGRGSGRSGPGRRQKAKSLKFLSAVQCRFGAARLFFSSATCTTS